MNRTIIIAMGPFLLVLLAIVVAIPVLLGLWGIGIYNSLVRLRNRFKNAFAQIDVQLKRRHELIPNLVETVKAYMKHERETLEAVIQARNAAESARSAAAIDPADPAAMQRLSSAESGLGGVLGRLFALSESYPELRSNENMKQLQEELSSTENKVAFARQAYNDAVMQYNNRRETFPANLIVGMLNFPPATMFEIDDEAERGPVKVDFGS